MRRTMLAAALAALPGIGYAETPGDYAETLAKAHILHMMLANECRGVLGGSSRFQAARSETVASLRILNKSRDEAVLMADEMAKEVLQFDDRGFVERSTATPEAQIAATKHCLDELGEAFHQIEVARALLRQSLGR